METPSEVGRGLRSVFSPARDFQQIRKAFLKIDPLIADGSVSASEAIDLKEMAFWAMKETALSAPDCGQFELIEFLLPYCLSDSEEENSQLNHSVRNCRKRLRDWLEGMEEPLRSSVRDEAIDRLCLALKAPAPISACWTIGSIGYRNSATVGALWEVVYRSPQVPEEEQIEEARDTAIAILCWLGLPAEERNQLLLVLTERAKKRCTQPLINAMRALADPRCLEIVLEYWMKPSEVAMWEERSFFLLSVLSEIAEAVPERQEIQDQIWSKIVALHTVDAARVGNKLYLGSDFAPTINSPSVIPSLFQFLFAKPDGQDSAEIRRYLMHLRVGECVLPRQLEGWLVPIPTETRSTLSADARSDTKSPGIYRTTAMDVKELAWETLLSSGDASLPTATAFEESARLEQNQHIRRRICEILACFRIDPLPPTAVDWVTERKDISRNGTLQDLLHRSSAARLLRGSATRKAFDALIDFGFTMEGSALLESINSLVEVAMSLAPSDPTICDKIAFVAEHGEYRHQRLAAAETLKFLAHNKLLQPHHGSGIPAALLDESKDASERSRLIAALGFLPPEFVTPDLESRLAEWASGTDMDSWRALETLALLDRLAQKTDLITHRLGLCFIDGVWKLDQESDKIDGAATVLALLYEKYPPIFLGAVCEFLKTRDWIYAASLVYELDRLFTGPNQQPLPPEIRDSMIERIRSNETSSMADLELFHFLARWAPRDLAINPWRDLWNDWVPDARAALAKALDEIEYRDDEAKEKAVQLCMSLADDGQYAVRRAAYRTLSRISEHWLRVLASMGVPFDSAGEELNDVSLEAGRRGAEACAWLAEDEDFLHYYEQFRSHPERTVRETIARTRSERRNRSHAQLYLQKVFALTKGDTDEMLGAWRFGRALQKTGDDTAIERIANHIASNRLPPNVRYWLERTAEGIEEQWKKTTEEWPDPWVRGEGSIEEGDGSIIHEAGEQIPVHYSLWKVPARHHGQAYSWGGVASASEKSAFLPHTEGDITLVLADGKRGRIVVSRNTLRDIEFKGQGHQPS